MVAFDSPLELRLLEDGHLLSLSTARRSVLVPGSIGWTSSTTRSK
jgi:hypothetical protein